MYFKEKYLKYKQKYLDLKIEHIGQRCKSSLNFEGGNNPIFLSSDNSPLQINDCFQFDSIEFNKYKDLEGNPIIFKISNINNSQYLKFYTVVLQGWKTSLQIQIDKQDNTNIKFVPDLINTTKFPPIKIESYMIKKIDCPSKMIDWNEIIRKENLKDVANILTFCNYGQKSIKFKQIEEEKKKIEDEKKKIEDEKKKIPKKD